jgi:hypothetical protein
VRAGAGFSEVSRNLDFVKFSGPTCVPCGYKAISDDCPIHVVTRVRVLRVPIGRHLVHKQIFCAAESMVLSASFEQSLGQ